MSPQFKAFIVAAALAIAGGAGCAALAVAGAKKSSTIEYLRGEVAHQDSLIVSMALMPTVTLQITNQFTSKAVLGKVVVQASVDNAAHQAAAILRGQLMQPAIADTARQPMLKP